MVPCIPQSSCIIKTSPSDCLVSYLEHLLGGFTPSAEKQPIKSCEQVLLLQVKLKLAVIAIKGYVPRIPRSTELEPNHQMQLSVIPKTHR